MPLLGLDPNTEPLLSFLCCSLTLILSVCCRFQSWRILLFGVLNLLCTGCLLMWCSSTNSMGEHTHTHVKQTQWQREGDTCKLAQTDRNTHRTNTHFEAETQTLTGGDACRHTVNTDWQLDTHTDAYTWKRVCVCVCAVALHCEDVFGRLLLVCELRGGVFSSRKPFGATTQRTHLSHWAELCQPSA